MAGGGRCPWRRRRIRQCRRVSKLGRHGGGNNDIMVKPGSRDSEEWICVRGHCIRRMGRMRVDANGDVYVPDSDEEEYDMELDARGINLRGPSVAADPITVRPDRVSGDGVDLATEGIPADAVEVVAKGDFADGIKVAANAATGEEIHPEVVPRLQMLLAQIDPTFHDIFISMYKVMVPAFFDP